MSGRSAVQPALVTSSSAERDTRRRDIAPHPLTFRSLTEPASSMVKPACIRNTNNAVLLMDWPITKLEDMPQKVAVQRAAI